MKEIDPKTTERAKSFEFFSKAPMPMVTIFKTLDVTHLIRRSKEAYKINMLMCYCIGLAAYKIPEFKMLPSGDKLYEYDSIVVGTIVKNIKGGITSCDMPFVDSLEEFNRIYLKYTQQAKKSCEDIFATDSMVIGTSCVPEYNIDGVVNQYSGIFNNPFLMWGKITDKFFFKKMLKISFQFHHLQMDGNEACAFLEELQKTINMI